jgi:uncharacterized metal-binding protein YceD (DUF177 family)
MSELAHWIDARHLPAAPVRVDADAAQCKTQAERFGLVAVESLGGEFVLEPDGNAVRANGRIEASIVQSCAVSGEDLPVTIDEPLALRFIPEGSPPRPDEELELAAEDCDEIEMDGSRFDLGEALAQSLALAIDPYAVGPEAEHARRKAGIVDEGASGPFSALAALKRTP